jgi:chemotaxis family two-component system response regulator Rcp1
MPALSINGKQTMNGKKTKSGKQIDQVFDILVIEDNAADVGLLRLALKETGLAFELTVIEDGAEALAYIRREGKYAGMSRPDLVVLDLNLPKKSGMEVLEAIRQNKEMSNVPVAVVTSSSAPLERAMIEGLRVERFITKPPELEDFLRIGGVLIEVLRESQNPATKV